VLSVHGKQKIIEVEENPGMKSELEQQFIQDPCFLA
jgi:hypothetical protein